MSLVQFGNSVVRSMSVDDECVALVGFTYSEEGCSNVYCGIDCRNGCTVELYSGDA